MSTRASGALLWSTPVTMSVDNNGSVVVEEKSRGVVQKRGCHESSSVVAVGGMVRNPC